MSKDHVAIVHQLCPICGQQDDGELLIDLSLRKDMSKIHNQNIGFGMPCSVCQGGIDQGAIMIIVVDAALSGDGSLKELYRTGEVFGVKEEAFLRWAKADTPEVQATLKKRITIMDYRIARTLGLPTEYKKIGDTPLESAEIL
jgi:RecJ-like exonuclease